MSRINQGDRVFHIDGRQGEVLELCSCSDGLPGARVEWQDETITVIPLGYIYTKKDPE